MVDGLSAERGVLPPFQGLARGCGVFCQGCHTPPLRGLGMARGPRSQGCTLVYNTAPLRG